MQWPHAKFRSTPGERQALSSVERPSSPLSNCTAVILDSLLRRLWSPVGLSDNVEPEPDFQLPRDHSIDDSGGVRRGNFPVATILFSTRSVFCRLGLDGGFLLEGVGHQHQTTVIQLIHYFQAHVGIAGHILIPDSAVRILGIL